MNIVVLGPGAIGCLWACKLTQAGHNVSLWGRDFQPELSLQFNKSEYYSFTNHNTLALQHADLVLVTVKAWQIESALKPLLPQLSKDTILLFIQNGMGTLDSLTETLLPYPVILGTTTHGALKTGQHVQHTGLGTTQIGAFNASGGQCQFLAEVLQHALPTVIWNDNIAHALWLKLFINCAINPLTALYQCTNGELANDYFSFKWHQIVDEIMLIADAEQLPYSADNLKETILNVIIATSHNRSSMHQDIANRRQTEIDYITGYLIKVGNQHHIELPFNQELFYKVKQIEREGLTQ